MDDGKNKVYLFLFTVILEVIKQRNKNFPLANSIFLTHCHFLQIYIWCFMGILFDILWEDQVTNLVRNAGFLTTLDPSCTPLISSQTILLLHMILC